MHPDDQNLSKAIQKYFASSSKKKGSGSAPQLDLRQIHDHEITSRVTLILGDRSLEPSDSPATAAMNQEVRDAYSFLLKAGYNASVSTLLQNDPGTLSSLEICDLPLISTSESVLTRWIELRPKTGDKADGSIAAEVLQIALNDPATALESDLAVWCCKNIAPVQIRKLSPIVAADQASGNKQGLLDIVLGRDKLGNFLTSWIRDDHSRLSPTADRFRLNPKLLKLAMDSAADWLQQPNAEVLVGLFSEIFRDLPHSTGATRAEHSGRLLTLAGSLIPIADNHPAAAALLQELQALGLQVWKSSIESSDRHRTWAFIQSGNRTLSETESSELGPDQAKALCLAIMRARKGKDALIELESAAVNLGGVRFGSEGESASFDAIIHNDLEGGLLPGDPVTIARPGIRFNENRIVKADVIEQTNR